jgi:exopolysaccharide biosynthesis polyprenyl glycosylphosphotransferase
VHAWTTALVRGPAGEVARLAHQVAGDRHPPFTVAAVQVTHGRLPGDDGVAGIPTVDIREDPVDAAIRLGVDALVLVGPQDEPSCDVRRCVWRLESHGIDTLMVPIAADIAAPSVTTVGDTGLPLLAFHARHVGAEVGFGKALLDKLLALVCIVLLSPVILATALAVKLTSRGPVLFRQVRVGIGGREFQMLKFRTMQVDAEARRAELEGLNKHSGGTLFKIEDDPRVTPVGRFLRRYSLDELPQLVNILKGEMALVGPRPPLPEEVAQYPVDAHRRFLVRPGLTGLWQVSGRSDLDPELGAQLDTHYVEQWSIGMDVHILARTPKAVISGKGAY